MEKLSDSATKSSFSPNWFRQSVCFSTRIPKHGPLHAGTLSALFSHPVPPTFTTFPVWRWALTPRFPLGQVFVKVREYVTSFPRPYAPV